MPERSFGIVNAVAAADELALVDLLASSGQTVVRFDGAGVVDKATFLARADAALPRPEDLHPHNWDAFADTIRSGLEDTVGDLVAIVWTDAHELVAGDLEGFLTAVDIIVGAARQVPKDVRLFLVGRGSGYRPMR